MFSYSRTLQESTPKNIALIQFFLIPFQHRKLIMQLSRREIAMRYKGSSLGLIWLFVEPLLMLIIYCLFLDFFLKTKWNINQNTSPLDLPLTLLIGLNFYKTKNCQPQLVNFDTLSQANVSNTPFLMVSEKELSPTIVTKVGEEVKLVYSSIPPYYYWFNFNSIMCWWWY